MMDIDEYFKDDRIDFDYAYIHLEVRGNHKDTRDIALHLSTYLMDRCSIDDLQQEQTWPEGYPEQFQLDVGGLNGMSHLTDSHQRAVLASHLASYGSYRYQSCWIGYHDYLCLLNEIETAEDLVYRFRQHGTGARFYSEDTLTYLKTVCDWFRIEYSQHNEEFSKKTMLEALKADY
jgi:hypothetical protein